MATIDDLDFALLGPLDALLTERHVTRAARRLGLTQSSMSHHLSRLRVFLGDPLLVRAGRAMVLTPRASALAEPLHAALARVRAVLTEGTGFDPASTTRTFVVACPDLLAPLVPELLAALSSRAPLATLRIAPATGDVAATLVAGSCDVALGGALDVGPGIVQRSLGAVSFGVLARRDHPVARRKLTVATWSAYPHVLVRSENGSPNRVGSALARAGVQRTVGVTVPSFLAAAWVVARSDMFFTAPRELTAELAEALGLVSLAPPVPLPTMPVAACWHERMQADEGHRFLRELLAELLLARTKRNARPAALPVSPARPPRRT